MRLSVIGAGYLGAVHATALASVGFDVLGVDRDPERVQSLNSGVPPFHEPGFEALLAAALAGGHLEFTTDVSQIADRDLHFLCVGTPQQQGKDAADLSQVTAAVSAMAPHLRDDSFLVGKSTVPVGTAAAIQEHLAGAGCGATVLWNPEFLREGFAVRDTLEPDRIVIGAPQSPAGQAGVAALRQVYSAPLSLDTPLLVTDIPTAELVKLSANAFLATKISFINAMAEMCDVTGADVTQLAAAIGHDARIGPLFLKAGVGFGGGCLPKDIRAFLARARELDLAEPFAFLADVDAVNQRARDRAVVAAQRSLGDVAGRSVTVLGAAFKPDSDDIRDSPALEIAVRLHELGADVRVHDPQALRNAVRRFPQLTYCPDINDALRDTDLVMVLTEWREYVALDPEATARMVRRKRIVDGRNCLPATAWLAAGWQFTGMGVPSHHPTPDPAPPPDSTPATQLPGQRR